MKPEGTSRLLTVLCCLLLALTLSAAALAEAAAPEIGTDVAEIQKYGNLVLNIKGSSLLDQGYAYGDLLKVTIAGQELQMPLGSQYSDVDNGNLICRVTVDEATGTDMVILAINMGDLASTLGVAVKTKIEEEPGYRWDYQVETPLAVTIAMQEKGGYESEYLLHQLTRTNERADYAQLSDEEYANFRVIATTGMGANALYRSTSPVNPELNRNHEADTAVNNAGIRTIMNLSDSEESMKAYEDYPTSFYAQRDIIALNLGVDFSAADFQEGLRKGLVYFTEHEGPYMTHCTEGKDRTGFVSAVLECLMGASADEVVADYMVTYYNFYGVEPGSDKYDAIARSNIEKSVAAAFGISSIYDADLAAGAEGYLKGIGLTDEQLAALKENLGRSWE